MRLNMFRFALAGAGVMLLCGTAAQAQNTPGYLPAEGVVVLSVQNLAV